MEKTVQESFNKTAYNRPTRIRKKYMTWENEWRCVIFLDEKKFSLDGPDYFKCYWHDLWAEERISIMWNFGGGTVTPWTAFVFSGKAQYVKSATDELLDSVLVDFWDKIDGNNCIFQQSKAALYTSRRKKNGLLERTVFHETGQNVPLTLIQRKTFGCEKFTGMQSSVQKQRSWQKPAKQDFPIN